MRIIKKDKLEEFFQVHQQGKSSLLKWYKTTKKVRWRNFAEMRMTFPSADTVKVGSGRSAVVFNIKKNNYRLITAVHYEKTVKDQEGDDKTVEGKVYLFFFLTHSEYDKNLWKDQL
jgi:mRNA interferase HigB